MRPLGAGFKPLEHIGLASDHAAVPQSPPQSPPQTGDSRPAEALDTATIIEAVVGMTEAERGRLLSALLGLKSEE